MSRRSCWRSSSASSRPRSNLELRRGWQHSPRKRNYHIGRGRLRRLAFPALLGHRSPFQVGESVKRDFGPSQALIWNEKSPAAGVAGRALSRISYPPAHKTIGAPRPIVGRDPTLGGRVPAELIAAVDAYAAKAGINRSDAMRRLLEAGLKRRPKA
jgi:hypothetical protein